MANMRRLGDCGVMGIEPSESGPLRERRAAGESAGGQRAWPRLRALGLPAARKILRALEDYELEAEDAVQEAFLAYLDRSARAQAHEPDCSVRFFRSLVRRRSFDRLRAVFRRRSVITLPELALLEDAASFGSGEARILDGTDWVAYVLSELSGDLRAVLELRIEGASLRQIASRLGIPEGTVKSRMARIRRKLTCSSEVEPVLEGYGLHPSRPGPRKAPRPLISYEIPRPDTPAEPDESADPQEPRSRGAGGRVRARGTRSRARLTSPGEIRGIREPPERVERPDHGRVSSLRPPRVLAPTPEPS